MANNFGQLGNRDFSAGYKPGDDFVNGNPHGLLRMDNLWLDETGAVTITRAPLRLNTAFSSPIVKLYSCFLNGVKTRFAQLENGQVWMDRGAGTFPTQVTSSINPSGTLARPSGFGQGFGKVFVGANTTSLGSATSFETDGVNSNQWGLAAPGYSPVITSVVPANACAFYPGNNGYYMSDYRASPSGGQGDGYCYSGTNTGGGLTFTGNFSATPLNLSAFPDNSTAQSTDNFYLAVYVGSIPTITGLTVNAITSSGNYYEFSFTQAYFAKTYLYANGWALITTTRGSFVAVGSPNWASIATVTVVITGAANTYYVIATPFEFYNNNPQNANLIALNNPYTYISQNLWAQPGYTGISPISPPCPSAISQVQSRPIWGQINSLYVQPLGSTSQTSFQNIYKNGGSLGGTYWLVNSGGVGTAFKDSFPDTYYLDQTSVYLEANVFLANISSITANIPIIGVVGPINGRMVFATGQNVYLTDYLNPESYDTRLVLTMSGLNSEIILWIIKIGQATILVGTTQDIYQIGGTFAQLADGTFDITISAQGVQQPPLHPAVALIDNQIMWVAKDGLRQSFISLLSQQSADLNTLFRGQMSFGVAGFSVLPFNPALTIGFWFDLAISKQKIYLRVRHLDNTLSMFVFDLQHKIWYRRVDAADTAAPPLCLFAELDDTLLVGYNDGSVRVYDQSFQEDNTYNQTVTMLTPCFDGGEPNTRKDLMTLKLDLSTTFTTGNTGTVSVYLQNDQGIQTLISNTVSSPYSSPALVALSCEGINIDSSRKYALYITGATPYFKLAGWYLDYYAHPEPQVFYREPPTNFGINGRKRIRTLPIILDCLGNTVTMQAYVDGAAVTPAQTFIGTGKQTYYFYFNSDIQGLDFSYTLNAGGALFEPYGLMGPISVEEMPPPTLEDQLGPLIMDKRGKLYGFKVRLIAGISPITYTIIMDDTPVYSATLATFPGTDTTYIVDRLPASLIGNQCRITLASFTPFFRYDASFRVTTSGMMSNQKWVGVNKDRKTA